MIVFKWSVEHKLCTKICIVIGRTYHLYIGLYTFKATIFPTWPTWQASPSTLTPHVNTLHNSLLPVSVFVWLLPCMDCVTEISVALVNMVFLTVFIPSVVFLAAQPVMEFGPKNLTVLDGKDATLTCRAAGAPAPNVTWIFNGEFLTFKKCSSFTCSLKIKFN